MALRLRFPLRHAIGQDDPVLFAARPDMRDRFEIDRAIERTALDRDHARPIFTGVVNPAAALGTEVAIGVRSAVGRSAPACSFPVYREA